MGSQMDFCPRQVCPQSAISSLFLPRVFTELLAGVTSANTKDTSDRTPVLVELTVPPGRQISRSKISVLTAQSAQVAAEGQRPLGSRQWTPGPGAADVEADRPGLEIWLLHLPALHSWQVSEMPLKSLPSSQEVRYVDSELKIERKK